MGKHDSWPVVTAECRPWTRWWWMGSAVDKKTIAQLLEEYRRKGLGGVEITSIYGTVGEQQHHIIYLSDEWIEMVRYTIAEANRLGMEVDLPREAVGGSAVISSVRRMELPNW